MANLSINLLPQELTAAKKQRQKASLVIQISVVALVLIIVAAGIVLSFRFAQTAQLSKVQSQIGEVRQRINSPDNSKREGLIVTLKSRLDSLNAASNQTYPASYAFALITKMMPTGTSIIAFTTDRKGKANLQVETADTATLMQLLNNLMDPQQNEQKITTAAIDSISLSRTGLFDTGVIINLTGGVK